MPSGDNFRTHGLSKTKLYNVWCAMKRRCYNKNTKDYKNYGGRGIKVCDEWLSYVPFYKWAMNNGYKANMTIDRIDNNGNYEPNNCRWISRTENVLKKRNNHKIKYNGQEMYLHELAKLKNINEKTLYNRIFSLGFSIEDATNLPIKKGNNQYLRKDKI